MGDISDRIRTLEDEVADEIDVEAVEGDRRIQELLGRGGPYDGQDQSYLHNYLVFLHLLPLIPGTDDVDGKVQYMPTTNTSRASVTGLFEQPQLPNYPATDLYGQYRRELTHLQKPSEEDPDHHTLPNFLVATKETGRLPWGPEVNDLDAQELSELCAATEYETVSERLGADSAPDNYRDCISMVQNHQTKPVTETYREWTDFSNSARSLVSTEYTELSQDDYSQILWYAVAYETDVVVVSRLPIDDVEFEHDIDAAPVDVEIVSDIDFETPTDTARRQLERVLN